MENKYKILIGISALVLSFGLGYYATPNKIVTKEVIKTETVKVEGKTKVIYRNKITKPDGTITENEVEKEETNSREESKSVATSEKSITKDLGLVLSGLYIVDATNISDKREYGITVSKRVFGALNVTGVATTDKRIGLGLGWSF